MEKRKGDGAVETVLFWDFDGTLIVPNASFLEALCRALQQHGYEIPAETVKTFLRTACTWYFPETPYPGRTGETWWDDLFRRFGVFYQAHSIPQAAHEALNACFRERILDAGTYELYPDAQAALAACADKGCTNYVLSNNYPELPQTAKALGLSDWIAGYVVSAAVGYEKPHPAIFRHALALAGFPKECYMIGDNPAADIAGGKRAGMKTVLVHAGRCAEADWCCGALAEILALLP